MGIKAVLEKPILSATVVRLLQVIIRGEDSLEWQVQGSQ